MPDDRQQSQHKRLTGANHRQRSVSRRQHSQRNPLLLLTVLTFADARQHTLFAAQRIVLTLLTGWPLSPRPPPPRSPSAIGPAD